MHVRNLDCTMVDGDSKIPGTIKTGYTSYRAGHELEIRERSFQMISPVVCDKNGEVVTPAVYKVEGFAPPKNKLHLFTRRTDGKYRLKGSRTVELVIGAAEVNQVFK